MIEGSENITLVRKERSFQASVSLVHANLEELSMNVHRLHPEEKRKYQAFRHDRRKTSYLLGRYAAKRALMGFDKMTSWESIWVDSGVMGFPVVRSATLPNMQVSISHCGPIGASIAFSEAHPMGIDVEKIDENRQEAMQSQLTEKELDLLKEMNLDHALGYTLLWSVKESMSKVTRTGMMIDFHLAEVKTITVKDQVYTSWFSHFGQYKTISFPFSDYVLSLTTPYKSQVDFKELKGLLGTF